jgi:DNA-binding PadR family transcriptional regulator
MEKELLILGIVRRGPIHGYRLWELLAEVPTGVRLKRSNAYRILDSLEKNGLISKKLEQDGNRPVRQVYQISKQGEREFQRMVRESLERDAGSDLPNTVALNYIDLIPADEAVDLLKRRLETIAARVNEFRDLSEAALDRHPGVGLAVAHDRFEHRFLSRLVDRLQSESGAG